MEKRERIVQLRVDELEEESLGDSPNPKVMRRRMYIGGVISRHRKAFRKQAAAEGGGGGEEMSPGFQVKTKLKEDYIYIVLCLGVSPISISNLIPQLFLHFLRVAFGIFT
jgi:hypothetical protein